MSKGTIDFEKLGAFYLGRRYDMNAGSMTEEPVLVDSRDLTTHAAIIGMTGSGKTGLFLDAIEEAAIDGLPAICIDPKGDLANLFLTFPQLRGKDFAPWVDPREAERKGMTPDAYGEAVAQQWKTGLASFGQDGKRIKRLRDSVDLALYTPKSSIGTPLAVLASLRAPSETEAADPELFDARVDTAAEGILTLLGEESASLSQDRAFLGTLLAHAWRAGESPSIGDLIRMVTDPPISRIGVLDLETFFPKKKRTDLALRLNAPLARPGFKGWLEGEPLDIQRLLYGPDGKPRVSIISIAHLNDRERMFFVTVLLNELIGWMRTQGGTSSLRALLAMDEVFGFLPPVQEPPSKRLFLTLLKQARAYGVGLMLATQNPVDVDYKALSNAGTWFLGRLQTERDVDRVLDGLLASGAGEKVDPKTLRQALAGLPKRVFILNNVHEPGPVFFHTRWAMSYLRGPLTREELVRLPQARGNKKKPEKKASKKAAAAASGATRERPVLTADLEHVFLGDAVGEVTYQPALLAEVDVHHIKASSNVDTWSEERLLAPLDEDLLKDLFGEAQRLPAAPRPQPEAETASFLPIPSGILSSPALRKHGASAKRFVYKHAKIELGRCKKYKLTSEVGESWDGFVARVRQAHREARDQAVLKVRARHEKKIATAERKVARAEDKVSKERGEARQSQLNTALGIGTTVLGALFGGRGGAVRGAATATRRVGRAMQQQGDVGRAQDALERAEEELEERREAARVAVTEAADLPEPTIERVELAPRKSDLSVRILKLAWVANPPA